jgi:hypothetical protein
MKDRRTKAQILTDLHYANLDVAECRAKVRRLEQEKEDARKTAVAAWAAHRKAVDLIASARANAENWKQAATLASAATREAVAKDLEAEAGSYISHDVTRWLREAARIARQGRTPGYGL